VSTLYCPDPVGHSTVPWPTDENGDPQCPFDNPITDPPEWAEPAPGVYWDWGSEVVTSFDDFERVAVEYDRETGEDLGGRSYTDEEHARADALQDKRALQEAQANLERAVQVNSAPEELAAVQELTLAGEGIEPGDPWRQPTGAHDAYPLGAVVSHNGGTWESTVAANVWEPGVSGWKDAGPGIPAWVQPTGAHDAYNQGDIVRHNDLVWQSNIDANVWEPPEQWTEIEEP
jgi:hypothetical protein